jgi:hypothetical protein
MGHVAILRDGTPIRTLLLDVLVFDVEGFLVGFKAPGMLNEHYLYFRKFDFKKSDRNDDVEGYYDKSIYYQYIQKTDSSVTIKDLKKFDFKNYLATVGEEITVTRVDFRAPFNYFYNYLEYTFNLQPTSDNQGVRNYLKPIFENSRIIDYEIDVMGLNGNTLPNSQSANAGGYFYNKNFGDFVNTLTLHTEIQKRELKKIVSHIIFRIRLLIKDVFPVIAENTHFFDKELDVANGIIDYDDPTLGFTELEKLLFDLKKSWGYYYGPVPGLPLPHRDGFDALFTSASTYNDYQIYYSGLVNFYEKCMATGNLSYYPSDKKLQYLLEILPPTALGTLPYSLIIGKIKNYLATNLTEENQQFLVKLVLSISSSRANDFLDFLLEKDNFIKTNFEFFYDVLTDARLQRISFVNWFTDGQTNKMYFAKAVYELWKVSKYNFEFIPNGVTPILSTPEFQGIDPNTYFYANPSEYIKDNVLEFVVSKLALIGNELSGYEIKFNSTISNDKISIIRITDKQTLVSTPLGLMPTNPEPDVTEFGKFHFYHPVALMGYEPNLELAISMKPIIPAFLFHYVEEFDRLADFDAAISLAVEITVDALLIYFTGGASVLNDLRYLRYTTNLGEAMTGPVSAMNAVEVWRGLNVADQAYTMTASSLAHINNYLITTENNPAKREILKRNQGFFLSLLVAQSGRTIYSTARASESASEVLRLIDQLPSGVAHGLSAEHILLLEAVSGQRTVAITTFGNRLTVLDEGAGFAAKYNNVFDPAKKMLFWKSFNGLPDETLSLLNAGENGVFMDNWLILAERNIAESKDMTFFTRQHYVDAMIRFHDESLIKDVLLQPLTPGQRLAFLERFGITDPIDAIGFNKIKNSQSRLELIKERLQNFNQGANQLDLLEIKAITTSQVDDLLVELLVYKVRFSLKELNTLFKNSVNKEIIAINELRDIQNGIINGVDIKAGWSNALKDKFQFRNKLFVEIKSYNGNTLNSTVIERYLSGNKTPQKFFNNVNPLPHNFIDFNSYDDFIKFSKRALDLEDIPRVNDTELKFIYNFITNHWNNGNRFVIELKSSLDICSSCQGYLMYLQKLGAKYGKQIDFKIVSHPEATNTHTLIEVIQ